mgnify:CR=1 FL=1
MRVFARRCPPLAALLAAFCVLLGSFAPHPAMAQSSSITAQFQSWLQNDLWPQARAKGVSILNSAPYAGYILATGARPDARYNYVPAGEDVIEATRRLEAACAAKGIDLATAALAFSLRNPDIDVTIPASGKPKRVGEWVAALDVTLSDEDWGEILAAAGGQYPLRH